MSRSGYPRNVIIRYADAMTDAPSLIAVDSHLVVDGRWSSSTVRSEMQRLVTERRMQLERDRYAHPVYPMGYETRRGPGDWELHPMPYVVGNQFWAMVELVDDRGRVTDARVLRYRSNAPHTMGARIDVFHEGELAGWIVRMTPIVERRVTVGWSVWWRPNNGQDDEYVVDRHSAAGKAAAFDDAVRATVRRYRGWA